MFKKLFELIKEKIAYYIKKRRLERILNKYHWTENHDLELVWYEAFVDLLILTKSPQIIYNGTPSANYMLWEKMRRKGVFKFFSKMKVVDVNLVKNW
jgi:hypothetical protein